MGTRTPTGRQMGNQAARKPECHQGPKALHVPGASSRSVWLDYPAVTIDLPGYPEPGWFRCFQDAAGGGTNGPSPTASILLRAGAGVRPRPVQSAKKSCAWRVRGRVLELEGPLKAFGAPAEFQATEAFGRDDMRFEMSSRGHPAMDDLTLESWLLVILRVWKFLLGLVIKNSEAASHSSHRVTCWKCLTVCARHVHAGS